MKRSQRWYVVAGVSLLVILGIGYAAMRRMTQRSRPQTENAVSRAQVPLSDASLGAIESLVPPNLDCGDDRNCITHCCPADQSCCGSKCCQTSRCCNGQCCGSDRDVCCNGKCSPPGTVCGSVGCSKTGCSGSAVCVDDSCRAPYDVIATSDPLVASPDRNGFWRNPNWAWEIAAGSTNGASPANKCGSLRNFPCTTMNPKLNVSAKCPCACALAGSTAPTGACAVTCSDALFSVAPCGVTYNTCLSEAGHTNWGVAALYGRLFYSDRTKQACLTDCDHNIDMHIRRDEDGIRIPVLSGYGAGGRHLEFKAAETTDLYGKDLPWWHQFASTDDAGRKAMMTDRDGVAIGVFSVDGAHYLLATELHPVWVFAVHVDTPGSKDDMWAVFFHRRLSEGYCGVAYQTLINSTIKIVLPWRANAHSVVHDATADRTQTNTTPASSYSVLINNSDRLIELTMNVPNNDPNPPVPVDGILVSNNPYFAGEIHFQWDVAAPPAVASTTEALVASGPARPRDPEEIANEQIERLPKAKQVLLRKNLANLEKRHDRSTPKTVAARLVDVSAMPKEPPADPTTAFRAEPNPQGEKDAQDAIEVIRQTLGKDTPELFQPRAPRPQATGAPR